MLNQTNTIWKGSKERSPWGCIQNITSDSALQVCIKVDIDTSYQLNIRKCIVLWIKINDETWNKLQKHLMMGNWTVSGTARQATEKPFLYLNKDKVLFLPSCKQVDRDGVSTIHQKFSLLLRFTEYSWRIWTQNNNDKCSLYNSMFYFESKVSTHIQNGSHGQCKGHSQITWNNKILANRMQ